MADHDVPEVGSTAGRRRAALVTEDAPTVAISTSANDASQIDPSTASVQGLLALNNPPSTSSFTALVPLTESSGSIHRVPSAAHVVLNDMFEPLATAVRFRPRLPRPSLSRISSYRDFVPTASVRLDSWCRSPQLILPAQPCNACGRITNDSEWPQYFCDTGFGWVQGRHPLILLHRLHRVLWPDVAESHVQGCICHEQLRRCARDIARRCRDRYTLTCQEHVAEGISSIWSPFRLFRCTVNLPRRAQPHPAGLLPVADVIHVARRRSARCAYSAHRLGHGRLPDSRAPRCHQFRARPTIATNSGRGKRTTAAARQRTFVVIGEGIAGIACARQLQHVFSASSAPAPKVIVLEARNRVGGRMYTHPLHTKTRSELHGTVHTTTQLPSHGTAHARGVDLGANIVTGWEGGNHITTIAKYQLKLMAYDLTHATRLYDSDGALVPDERDLLCEAVFNEILEETVRMRASAKGQGDGLHDVEMGEAGDDEEEDGDAECENEFVPTTHLSKAMAAQSSSFQRRSTRRSARAASGHARSIATVPSRLPYAGNNFARLQSDLAKIDQIYEARVWSRYEVLLCSRDGTVEVMAARVISLWADKDSSEPHVSVPERVLVVDTKRLRYHGLAAAAEQAERDPTCPTDVCMARIADVKTALRQFEDVHVAMVRFLSQQAVEH